MEKAKEEGWVNVSDFALVPKGNFTDVTQLKSPGLRSHVTPSAIFRRIISDDFLRVLEKGANAHVKSSSLGSPGPRPSFTTNDFQKLVCMILDVIGQKIEEWEIYLRDPDRTIGLTVNTYKDLRKHLEFSFEDLTNTFNQGVKETVEIGGHGAVDESMVPWRGDSEFSITIPRKPKSTGLRFYVLSFPLTSTGQPIVYHVIPDLRIPFYGGKEVLDEMALVLPEGRTISITADAFFGTPSWLKAQEKGFYTLSCSSVCEQSLFPLFASDLGPKEYRNFFNGINVVTLWQDNVLVITTSNLHTPQPLPHHDLQGRYRGVNLTGRTPILSIESIQKLMTFPHEELKAMAKAMGKSSSGTIRELAYLIAGRLPPPVQPAGPSSSNPPQGNGESSAESQSLTSTEILAQRIKTYADANSAKSLQSRCISMNLSTSKFRSLKSIAI